MSMELAEKKCVPCRGGVPRLTDHETKPLLAQLDGWNVNGQGKLEKSYTYEKRQ